MSDSIDPLVSFLIPCCNAERSVAQATESALAQTWLEKESFVKRDVGGAFLVAD